MGRPIQADAEFTRRRILEAASELFSARGSGAVSIRDIAKEAGITLATVHHYFGTKEQLYDACIQAMYAELESLRESLEPAFRRESQPTALLEASVRASFRFAVAHRGAIRLLMRTIIDTGHLEPVRRANVHLPFLERAGVVLGAVFDRDVNEMRMTVQSVMHLIVRYALTAPSELGLLAHEHDETKALRMIENHLVKVAAALAGVEATEGGEEE
jgi:AcrR family transcriptional regulator